MFAEQVRSGVQPFVMCEISSFATGGSEFPPGHPMRAVKAAYNGNLWNPTDRIAHDLRVLVHDPALGYFWSQEPPVLRKVGESADWLASGPVDEDSAVHLLEAVYGEPRPRWYVNVLKQNDNNNYVTVFYCDVNGTLYATFSLISKPLTKDQIHRLRLTQILRPPM